VIIDSGFFPLFRDAKRRDRNPYRVPRNFAHRLRRPLRFFVFSRPRQLRAAYSTRYVFNSRHEPPAEIGYRFSIRKPPLPIRSRKVGLDTKTRANRRDTAGRRVRLLYYAEYPKRSLRDRNNGAPRATFDPKMCRVRNARTNGTSRRTSGQISVRPRRRIKTNFQISVRRDAPVVFVLRVRNVSHASPVTDECNYYYIFS